MSDGRPNLLFIFPDQWRGDALSCLGHPLAETPLLDDLATRGTTFRRAYTNSPVCISARASLITGQSPSTCGRLGYRDFLPWRYPYTLMTCLRDAGYQTMSAGKTHFYPGRARLGFEELQLYDNQRVEPGFESDYDLWLRRMTNGAITDSAQRLDSNAMVVHPWTDPEHLHANAWNVTAAIELLERRDPTRPYFLQVGFHRPHPPLDPPLQYFQRYEHRDLPEPPMGEWARDGDWPTFKKDPGRGRLHPSVRDRCRRGYYAQLAHLDFEIGRLLRHLQLRGQLKNTWIVFSSDHGEQLGDHGFYRKSTPFESSARIPLLIIPPPEQEAPRNVTCDAPVALFDLMPTFLEMANVPIPNQVEAESLMPLIQGTGELPRQHIHLEMVGSPIGSWEAIVDGRWKYVWQLDGREFLFDLVNDPTELHDLSASLEAAAELARWRQALVGQLAARPEDGLVEDGRLVPGKGLPVVRPWVAAGEMQPS